MDTIILNAEVEAELERRRWEQYGPTLLDEAAEDAEPA